MTKGSLNGKRFAAIDLAAFLLYFMLNCTLFWVNVGGAWAEAEHRSARFLPVVALTVNLIMLAYIWATAPRRRAIAARP